MSEVKRDKLPMELIKRLADGCNPAYDENGKDLSYDYEELITSMAQHVLELSAKLEIVNTLMDAATELNNLAKENTEKLVAENAALKAAFNPVEIPEDAVDALGDTARFDWDSNESGSWTWVENDTDVIRAVLDAMPKPETPLTDEFTAELRAQGVDELITSIMNETGLSSDWPMEELRAFAANLRAGRKG